MPSILDELKLKANGAADQANNIQEAVSMMEFGGGGSGGGLVAGIDWDETLQTTVLDKTWQEIHDAFPFVTIVSNDAEVKHFVTEVVYDNDRYVIYMVRCFYVSNTQLVFETYKSSSEDGVLALTTE